ncbi:MAG TPA: hypothetical protein VL475_07075 [Planctomycetaceae bacterium]|nr:hypothetical protein [Planctomycetaceae bacterium]
MKRFFIAFIAGVVLAVTPALSYATFLPVGSSVTLDQLVAGGTLTVGDKLFDHFSYSKTGDMPAAGGVTVQGIVDSAGNYGILFTGTFQDLFGGGASDALIKFFVTVLDPTRQIVGANLFGDPTVTGTGLASLTETFVPLAGSMHIYDNTTHTGIDTASSSVNPSQAQISVQKDILAFANSDNSIAGFTFVGQTFVQTPLPGSLVLLLTGGLTLVPICRMRRRQK